MSTIQQLNTNLKGSVHYPTNWNGGEIKNHINTRLSTSHFHNIDTLQEKSEAFTFITMLSVAVIIG